MYTYDKNSPGSYQAIRAVFHISFDLVAPALYAAGVHLPSKTAVSDAAVFLPSTAADAEFPVRKERIYLNKCCCTRNDHKFI